MANHHIVITAVASPFSNQKRKYHLNINICIIITQHKNYYYYILHTLYTITKIVSTIIDFEKLKLLYNLSGHTKTL